MAVVAETAVAMAGAAAKAAADGTGSQMKITGNPRGSLANHAGRFDSQSILRVVRFAEPELATLRTGKVAPERHVLNRGIFLLPFAVAEQVAVAACGHNGAESMGRIPLLRSYLDHYLSETPKGNEARGKEQNEGATTRTTEIGQGREERFRAVWAGDRYESAGAGYFQRDSGL
jgi:hypothetical protein